MAFTRKIILGIVVISLLGSTTLAYGLSTEFLFKFDSNSSSSHSITTNSSHIFVGDTGTDQVEIFDLSGNSVKSFSVTDPRGIAVNSTHIFVTRDNGAATTSIDLFNISGSFNSTLVGAGVLTNPRGIAVNSTHVLVADEGTDQVDIFNLSGNRLPVPVDGGQLGNPTDVTIDSNGRIIVSDTADDKIEIFDSLGNYLSSSSFGSSGTNDGEFMFPISVDVDSNNRIIVSDIINKNIQIFDSSGNFLTTFGSSGTNDGEFTNPSSLSVDTSDRIIVSDSNGASSRIQVFAYASESSTGGGSANKHKTAPTSGNDWNTHNPLVKEGVSVDGKSFDITDNWWTPFEQIQISTSSMHTFTAKTFAQNGGLMVQEFAFGIPQIGEYQNAEAMIEVHYNYDKSIRDIVVVQDTEVIMVSSINATTEQVSCDGGASECYQTTVSMVFNEPLKDKVYAIHAYDMSRRSMMPHYFNDGVNIVGEMMNPLPTKTIPGTIKGEGLITITQIEKYSDLWIAKDGRIFEMYGISDSFKHVNQSYERNIDSDTVKNRNHSAYSNWLLWQEKVATEIFDSSLIQGSDKGFTSSAIDEDGIDQRTETLQKLNWR